MTEPNNNLLTTSLKQVIPSNINENDTSGNSFSTRNSKSCVNYILEIRVSDPQKKIEDRGSSGPYVSYQISTKTNNPSYHTCKIGNNQNATMIGNEMDKIIVVHRRYSDLLLLQEIFYNDYPTCIIPPLPDKKVFQYIAGDRFSQRFTQKRCHSLQNFLRRIACHPILSESNVLRMFLASDDWESYKENLAKILPSAKEEVTDSFMNAFKSVHNQSEEFVEVKEKNDKLNHTITKLDKIFHKVVKKNDLICDDFSKLGTSLQELNDLIKSNQELRGHSTNDVNDEELSQNLKKFTDGIIQLSYGLSDLNKYLDYEYLVDLKDLEHFIDSMRQLVKLKDQKQIDYEELSEYLAKSVKMRDNLISGYGGTNFFTNKLEEIAGINQESVRREKINKLENKIGSLNNELESAKKIANAFEKETIKEIKLFEETKTKELKRTLGNLADNHIKFYEKMLETWTEIDANLK